MTKYREILRLTALGLSQRNIVQSIGVSHEYSVTSEPLNPLHRATHSECRSHPYEKVNPLLRATS